MTLAEIRRDRGAAGVRTAIAEAIEKHGTIREAAESLGCLPHVLKRAAKGVGMVLPDDTRGTPKGTAAYEKRWGERKKQPKTKPPKGIDKKSNTKP